MKRRPERVFTVRMWAADGPGATAPAWRGAVYDVATGKMLYVADPREVGDCLAAALGATAGDSGAKARSRPLEKLPRD